MAEERISNQRVEAIIAAYGADPERWPEAERAGALARLERSGERRDQLQGEAELDALLGGLGRPQPSNMLKAKLLEDASVAVVQGASHKSRVAPSASPGWLGRFADMVFETVSLKPLALGGLMVPVLALGIWLGASLTSEPLGDEDLLAAFGEDYELWTGGDLPDPSDITGET